MPTDMEARVVSLEETVAHQSRVIDELSDQLAEQWQSWAAPAITRPPHY